MTYVKYFDASPVLVKQYERGQLKAWDDFIKLKKEDRSLLSHCEIIIWKSVDGLWEHLPGHNNCPQRAMDLLFLCFDFNGLSSRQHDYRYWKRTCTCLTHPDRYERLSHYAEAALTSSDTADNASSNTVLVR